MIGGRIQSFSFLMSNHTKRLLGKILSFFDSGYPNMQLDYWIYGVKRYDITYGMA
jgi:hypothetical protein